MKTPRLLDTFELGDALALRNRIVMAPMTTWAANDDGTVSSEEENYYRLRVKDVGLVITGCTHVQANGIGFTGEFAAWDDRFIPSLTRLATAAKSGGAPAILQIFHAGVKTLPHLASDVVAASAVAGEAGAFAPAVTPRALQDDEIVELVQAFGQATRRAIVAGFDGVELHGAHSFLLQNFFSPYFNRRTDRWGDSLENRMRFPLAVVEELRKVIARHADRPFVLGYRMSPEESNEGGLRIADSLRLADRLVDTGISYLHLSLHDALEDRPIGSTDDSPTIVQIVQQQLAGRIPLVAAGQIRTPDQAERAVAAGVSLVAIGQGLVMNPDWAAVAQREGTGQVALDVAASDVPQLGIPSRLWDVIAATTGWFSVRQPT